MKIIHMNIVPGPNIYCYRPVIIIFVDLGRYKGITTDELPGFNERLLSLLPTLAEHHCSRGYRGGFRERLWTGTYLGHVVEHVALELQVLLGEDVYFGQTRSGRDHYRVVFEYGCKQVGQWAGQAAVELIYGLLQEASVDPEKLIRRGGSIKRRYERGPSTKAMLAAADKRGIPIFPLGEGETLFQLGQGCKRKRISAALTEETRCLGVDLAGDKWLTRVFLSEQGLPFPRGYLTGDEEKVVSLGRKLGYPLVVKPCNCNQGKGVTLNINNERELREAFQAAQEYSRQVLVEEHIPGRDYRLLVVGKEMVAAAERVPPYIIGDGYRCIEELTTALNSDPQRGEGHARSLTRITVDRVVKLMLKRQGYTLQSRPRAGEKVYLRSNGNLSTGGTAIDVTTCVHPENAAMAVRAASLVGLDIAGVDLITPDIALPIRQKGGAFIEVNAAPGLRMHHFPTVGEVREVGGAIIDYLFPAAENGRIPIVVITGTNGKTTVARLISHILAAGGFQVGLATTEGLFVGGKQVLGGDCAGPRSARNILTDPTVEAAVLETARGGIIQGGLGYDRASVAVITNITEDHLDGEMLTSLGDLWHVKSLVAEQVLGDGRVVVNVDDPYLSSVLSDIKKRLLLCSRYETNLFFKKDVEGLFLRGADIIIRRQVKETYLGNIKAIPITWEGRAAHQVENVLLAAGATLALGVDVATIRQGLETFHSSLNPGRLELIESTNMRVVLDYGHNASGFARVVETVKNLPYLRLIGVVGVPGDRQDETIIGAGRILAESGFDMLIIKEDVDLRGRRPGEVAGLLVKGLEKAGYKKELHVILPEKDAVAELLKRMREGDTAIVFYEKDRDRLKAMIEKELKRKTGDITGKYIKEKKRDVENEESYPAIQG